MDSFEKDKISPITDSGKKEQGVSSLKKVKIDPRNLILYSEIMKPKFDE